MARGGKEYTPSIYAREESPSRRYCRVCTCGKSCRLRLCSHYSTRQSLLLSPVITLLFFFCLIYYPPASCPYCSCLGEKRWLSFTVVNGFFFFFSIVCLLPFD
ncbi:hypothetical protein V8C26DRAFT_416032 [Trichoderma gracile]